MWCRKLSLGKIDIMDMSYIMDSGQNWLYPTFRNIFWPLSAKSADLSKNQKNHFFKKNAIFLVENLPEKGQNWFNSKTTIVPSPHEHSLQTYNNGFFISQHRFSAIFPHTLQKWPFFPWMTKPTNGILCFQIAYIHHELPKESIFNT